MKAATSFGTLYLLIDSSFSSEWYIWHSAGIFLSLFAIKYHMWKIARQLFFVGYFGVEFWHKSVLPLFNTFNHGREKLVLRLSPISSIDQSTTNLFVFFIAQLFAYIISVECLYDWLLENINSEQLTTASWILHKLDRKVIAKSFVKGRWGYSSVHSW